MAKSPTKTLQNHFIIILCGGTGPRLWPISRADHPKQFLNLIGNESFIRQTVQRSLKILPSKNIFIVSNLKYQKQITKELKELIPPQNFIFEPDKKNTAAAILYACSIISQINPDAVITSLPSDHYISKNLFFASKIKKSAKLAYKLGRIILIGIKPTFPNPSYGYLSVDKPKNNVYKVKNFIEKPDTDTANKLIQKGNFWNSGIYTFHIPVLLEEFIKYQPKYFRLYQKLIDNPNSVKKIYKLFPKLAIDYAISENSSKLSCLKSNFIWSDIGEWNTVYQMLNKNNQGIATLKSDTNFTNHNSQNCLISSQSNKLIGLVGVKDLAIIDTPDGLLICHLNDTLQVRDLITKMVSDKKQINYFLKSPK